MLEEIWKILTIKLKINNENYKDNIKNHISDYLEVKSGGI